MKAIHYIPYNFGRRRIVGASKNVAGPLNLACRVGMSCDFITRWFFFHVPSINFKQYLHAKSYVDWWPLYMPNCHSFIIFLMLVSLFRLKIYPIIYYTPIPVIAWLKTVKPPCYHLLSETNWTCDYDLFKVLIN